MIREKLIYCSALFLRSTNVCLIYVCHKCLTAPTFCRQNRNFIFDSETRLNSNHYCAKDKNKMENGLLFKFTDRALFESLAPFSIDILCWKWWDCVAYWSYVNRYQQDSKCEHNSFFSNFLHGETTTKRSKIRKKTR